MDDFFKSLPPWALALVAICAGLAFFMLNEPPKTICDVQKSNFLESQTGVIFPAVIKKNKVPPSIVKAKEACLYGNSAGSCYHYLGILNKLAKDLAEKSSECLSPIFDISELKLALLDGAEVMVRLAWGGEPPEIGPNKLGWLQDSEVAIYCRLKNVIIRSTSEVDWNQLRLQVFKKLPGKENAGSPTLASSYLSDSDIWSRSLYSIRCENSY
ncbi:MAG: hypothetical protein ACOYOK_02840 [Pseudobdellovibrionaceae bacterium]